MGVLHIQVDGEKLKLLEYFCLKITVQSSYSIAMHMS